MGVVHSPNGGVNGSLLAPHFSLNASGVPSEATVSKRYAKRGLCPRRRVELRTEEVRVKQKTRRHWMQSCVVPQGYALHRLFTVLPWITLLGQDCGLCPSSQTPIRLGLKPNGAQGYKVLFPEALQVIKGTAMPELVTYLPAGGKSVGQGV